MERVKVTDLDTYLEAIHFIHELGLKDYVLVGYGDSLKIIIYERRIKSSILFDFITTFGCDISPTSWGSGYALEIVLMKKVL